MRSKTKSGITKTTSSTGNTGKQAELLACRHLKRHGLTLIERNYRSPFGEIDLIMYDGSTLVFVEVRLRARSTYGTPAETVNTRKQERLRLTAEHYLQHDQRASKKPCRFDIVAIDREAERDHIVWLQNAF